MTREHGNRVGGNVTFGLFLENAFFVFGFFD